MRGFLPAFVIFNNYAVSSYRVLLNFSKKSNPIIYGQPIISYNRLRFL